MIAVLAIASVPGGVVQAFPPLPSSFYGSIKLNGANLPAGTTIQALINGEVYATSTIELYQGDSIYSLIVPGDDLGTIEVEGGVEGSVISFRVNGEYASQTATWQSGTNEVLDLTITSSTTPVAPTSTPTPTITVTGTLAPQTATPTLAGGLTETPQPTLTGTQAPLETLQESDASAYPVGTEDQSAEAELMSNPTQDSGGSAVNSGDDSEISSPDQKDVESVQTDDHVKSWIVIGIGGVVLVIIGIAGWFLSKRNRPDQDLL